MSDLPASLEVVGALKARANSRHDGRLSVNRSVIRTLVSEVERLQDADAAADALNANVTEFGQRIDELTSRLARAEELLRGARDIVDKWCFYQGNTHHLYATYLDPIDAYLAPPIKPEA